MDEDKKKYFKVLNIEDIRKLANNWTLASDVGLLAHLEQFSEQICNQAQSTQKNFQELFHDYEELHSSIDNITNQFLALQNCQFVENRVYDEETPVEENIEKKVINEDEQEKILLLQYKQAVEIGIKLLDTHFQEVNLPPSSDSDDEDESGLGNSLIWRPTNPYVGKKFPLLIGSVEWWSDDNVGLGNSEKNLDTEKVFSESDSEGESIPEIEKKMSSSFSSTENDKIVSNNLLTLDSSTENMFGLDKKNNFHKSLEDNIKNFANEVISAPSVKENKEYKTETIEQLCCNNKMIDATEISTEQSKKLTRQVNMPFSQELAKKLQFVSPLNKSDESKNEKKHNQNQESNYVSKDMFDDNEEDADLFSAKTQNLSKNTNNLFFNAERDDQLFSDSSNLFFESQTNMFDSVSVMTNKNNSLSNLINKEILGDSKTLLKNKPILQEENLSKSLFADLDDDEKLFNSYPINVDQPLSRSLFSTSDENFEKTLLGKSNHICKTDNNKTESLYENDTDDDLFSEPTTSFTHAELTNCLEYKDNIFKNNTLDSLNEEFSDLLTKKSKSISKPTNFEETNYLNASNKYEILSNISNEKNISVISPLRTENPKNEKTELYNEDDDNTKEYFFLDKESASVTKLASALEDDDVSLFLEKASKPDTLSISSSRSSLFDDVSASKTKLASIFEKDKYSKLDKDGLNNSLFVENSLNQAIDDSKTKNEAKKVNSLFEDYDNSDTLFGFSSQSDDLFGSNILATEKKLGKFDIVKEKKKNFPELHFPDENTLHSTSLSENSATKCVEKEKVIFSGETCTDEFQSKTSHSLKSIKLDNPLEYLRNQSKEIKTKLSTTDNENHLISISAEKVIEIENSKLIAKENLSDIISIKPKPPNSLEVRKDSDLQTNNVKDKNVGKLIISDALKSKFESLVNPYPLQINKEIKIVDEVKKQSSSDDIFERSIEAGTNLLKCPSKDRVRIPARRRPQSRQARQEAIRNSEPNFQISTFDNSVKSQVSVTTPNNHENLSAKKESLKNFSKSLLSSPVPSNPLSPLTDEEDFFNIPELDTNFEKEDQRIFKSNLFRAESISKIDNSLLFDAAPILSPLISQNINVPESKSDDNFLFQSSEIRVKNTQNSFFGDDDDEISDDDCSLFKINNTPQNKASNLFITQEFKKFSSIETIKEPLFDTSDVSEDLFKEKLSDAVAKNPFKDIAKKSDKTINIMGKKNEPFIDPLGIMFSDQK